MRQIFSVQPQVFQIFYLSCFKDIQNVSQRTPNFYIASEYTVYIVHRALIRSGIYKLSLIRPGIYIEPKSSQIHISSSDSFRNLHILIRLGILIDN